MGSVPAALGDGVVDGLVHLLIVVVAVTGMFPHVRLQGRRVAAHVPAQRAPAAGGNHVCRGSARPPRMKAGSGQAYPSGFTEMSYRPAHSHRAAPRTPGDSWHMEHISLGYKSEPRPGTPVLPAPWGGNRVPPAASRTI